MANTTAAELRSYLEEQRQAGAFPAWQAYVCDGERVVFDDAAGWAVIEPERIEAGPNTLFDLASLTKPLITGVLALRLAQDGALPLGLPVSRVLDALCEAPLDTITVLDLLTHRAGFRPWAALYLEGRPQLGKYAERVAALPLHSPPGSRVAYSDLGYLVLGAAIERIAGQPFQKIVEQQVLGPAGIGDLLFRPVSRRQETAATERGNDYERRLANAEPDDARFRRDMIWGDVHDGNAFALGGVAPHAGLFGTARAVAAMAASFRDGSRLLVPGCRALAFADLTADLAADLAAARTADPVAHRSAVFELAGVEGTSAAGALEAGAVGHTGFTGTSLWLDATGGRVYVLLTNRVHPVVSSLNMNAIRRGFHSIARELPSG